MSEWLALEAEPGTVHRAAEKRLVHRVRVRRPACVARREHAVVTGGAL